MVTVEELETRLDESEQANKEITAALMFAIAFIAQILLEQQKLPRSYLRKQLELRVQEAAQHDRHKRIGIVLDGIREQLHRGIQTPLSQP